MTRKLRVNTGGYIEPSHVVGRDHLIEQLWRQLQQKSLILTSERRVGKSSVIRKMQDQCPENWYINVRDVEGIGTIKEFVSRLLDDLYQYQNKTNKSLRWIKAIRKELDGWSVFGITVGRQTEPDWISVLEQLLNGLCEELGKKDEYLLLIWDEFPWLLQKLSKNQGPEAAASLLDNLRQARQKNSNIRMIYTGSIGLHHALNSLKSVGFSNEPINDLKPVVTLPPLFTAAAIELINALLEGESIQPETDDFANYLAEVVDNVPYYIHHTLNTMLIQNVAATKNNVDKIINAVFVDSDDPWDLKHYRARMKDYYPRHLSVYKEILDTLAHSDTPLDFPTIKNQVLSSPTIVKDSQLLTLVERAEFMDEALQLLCSDHYLTRDPDTLRYQFAYPLIKRWWQQTAV